MSYVSIVSRAHDWHSECVLSDADICGMSPVWQKNVTEVSKRTGPQCRTNVSSIWKVCDKYLVESTAVPHTHLVSSGAIQIQSAALLRKSNVRMT